MKQKRKQRFFHKSLIEKKNIVSLKGESAHYLTRVLRLKNGQNLILFDGSVQHEVPECDCEEKNERTKSNKSSTRR